MEPRLPRRRFLTGTAFAACALLAPRSYGGFRSVADPTAIALSTDDQAVIAELAAYSIDVRPWAGPTDFARPKRETDPEVERSTNLLVRVSDFDRLARYLNSRDLDRLGVVYAGGPHLAFFAGATAYTITNYGPEDFYRATS
jgi:hypothetical protein